MYNNEKIEPDYNILAKHFAKETNYHEIQAIEDWLKESDDNRKSYDQMYYLWLTSNKQKYIESTNIDDAWSKMKNRIDSNTENTEKPKLIADKKDISIYRRTLYRFLQLAAIVVIGLIIRQIIVNEPNDGYLENVANVSEKEIVLPDKSIVNLSKESKVYYPEQFAADKRHVKLEGEAFFKISADKKRPFIIDAQFAQIKVLGTSFNVKAFKNEDFVEVDVKTGVVELYSPISKHKKLVLKKGESGILRNSEQNAIKTKTNDNLFAKKIIFKDTKLVDVAKTLKDAYGVDIKIKDKEIKQYKFTMVMYNIGIDSVMNSLKSKHNNLIIKKITENKFTIHKIEK